MSNEIEKNTFEDKIVEAQKLLAVSLENSVG